MAISTGLASGAARGAAIAKERKRGTMTARNFILSFWGGWLGLSKMFERNEYEETWNKDDRRPLALDKTWLLKRRTEAKGCLMDWE